MNRRYFLGVIGSLAVSVSKPLMAFNQSLGMAEDETVNDIRQKLLLNLKSIFFDQDSIVFSSGAIQEKFEHYNENNLYHSLFGTLNDRQLLKFSDNKKSLSVYLLSKIEEDFKNSNVMYLDGWCLSNTEVEVCLLA